MNRFQNLLKIYPGEGRLVFIFAFLLFSNMIGQQISQIVSVSGFMSSFGAREMVLVNMVNYVVILLIVALQSLTIDRGSRVRQVAVILLVYSSIYIFIRVLFYTPSPAWVNYGLLYLLSDQTFWYYPTLVWALVNDIFSVEQGKRFFNVINSGATVGSLLGIGISTLTPALVKRVGIVVPDILYLNVAVYLINFLLVVTLLRNVRIRKMIPKDQSIKETLSEGFMFIREVPFFRYMAIFVIGYWMTYAILDYRFYVMTKPVFTNLLDYQRFFGAYRLASIIALLLTQLLITNPIVDRLQMKNAFVITPIAGVVVGICTLIVPGFWTAVLGMFFYILILRAFTRVAWKTAAGLVPEEKRGRVTIFLEAYVPAVFIWLAYALSLGFSELGSWLKFETTWFYPVAIVLLGLIGVYAAYQISKTYETSLMNWRLRRRQKLGSPILDKLKDL
jgi:hypothetical protein